MPTDSLDDGWLTTKKRGRDDDAIQRDAAMALAARRRVKKKSQAKQSRSFEENDEDSFVDNDVELHDDESSVSTTAQESSTTSADETENRLNKIPKSSVKNNIKKNVAKQRKRQQVIVLDDSSSEEDDDLTTTRRSTGSKGNTRPFSSSYSKTAAPKKTSELLSLSSSDDDDDDDDLPKSVLNLASSSNTIIKSNKTSKEEATGNTNAPVLQKQQQDSLLDDTTTDDESNNILPRKQASRHFNHNNNNNNNNNNKSFRRQKRRSVLADSDDEDEALAMALAISQSMLQEQNHLQDTPVTTKKKKKKKKKKSKLGKQQEQEESDDDDLVANNDNNNNLALLQDSDDNTNDDDNDDNDDEYMDQDAREAQTVLETANKLSLEITKSLQEWSNESVVGLISSGAVSLGQIQKESATTTRRRNWISAEEMQDICPKLTLADYQLIGINWMALLNGMQCHVGGTTTSVNGVLADEMGLGKTVQTIAFLSWLNHHHHEKQNTDTQPHLVICPSSVLANWEREFQTFAPHLKVVKYHGSMAERHELQEKLRPCLPGGKKTPPHVILAPITFFQTEKADDRSFLRKFHYEYLIVDEAHLLKNARGTRYKSLDKFKSNKRLLLTGTPVQNSPQELLALLCFLMPLFSKKASMFEDDVNDGGATMLQHFVSLEKGSSEQEAYGKLKQLFAPFVLRRRKRDVLSQIMPPKVHKVELIDLDPTARHLYNSMLSDHVKNKKTNAQQREHLFTQLRKAAHHPLLLRSRYTSSQEKEHLVHCFYKYGAFRGEGCTKARVAEELDRYNDFMIHLTAHDLLSENPLRKDDLERYILEEDDLFSSSKFVRLGQLIPKLIEEGHRILIFSGWTSCLDLLTCLLEKLKIDYLRMEGSTPVEERQSLIDEFTNNSQIPIFLLSTKACGLGINLTCADTCIFYDIDYNPMNDAQAEDRCHRIGQKKDVTVIRLVSKETVDEDIYNMQQRKMKMSQAIMETHGEAQENSKSSLAKEKNTVLKNALDRFLQSPGQHQKESASQDSRDMI